MEGETMSLVSFPTPPVWPELPASPEDNGLRKKSAARQYVAPAWIFILLKQNAVYAAPQNVALRGLQNYEYGNAEPRLSILVRMADFYGVSIDYLAGRTDTP